MRSGYLSIGNKQLKEIMLNNEFYAKMESFVVSMVELNETKNRFSFDFHEVIVLNGYNHC